MMEGQKRGGGRGVATGHLPPRLTQFGASIIARNPKYRRSDWPGREPLTFCASEFAARVSRVARGQRAEG